MTIGKAPQCAPDAGLGKLIDAIDVLVRPAPDGMAYDHARVARIAAAFMARDSAPIGAARARLTPRAVLESA